MSERDFAMALALLAEAMGEQKLTPVRIEAYHRGLKDIPLALLQATVDRLIQTIGSDTFRWTALPPVADIRKMAETIRRERVAGMRFQPCAMCSASGWTEREIDGVKRAVRCGCWTRHQANIAALGPALAALPAARVEDEEPTTALALEDAPPAITDRVRSIAAQKVLR